MSDVLPGKGPRDRPEPFMRGLTGIVAIAVYALAALVVLAIVVGVVDTAYELAARVIGPLRFDIGDLVSTFGTTMAVVVAIEIFESIVLFLREDHIPVDLVLATALTALARKLILTDYKVVSAAHLAATAAAVLALALGYWLTRGPSAHARRPPGREPDQGDRGPRTTQ